MNHLLNKPNDEFVADLQVSTKYLKQVTFAECVFPCVRLEFSGSHSAIAVRHRRWHAIVFSICPFYIHGRWHISLDAAWILLALRGSAARNENIQLWKHRIDPRGADDELIFHASTVRGRRTWQNVQGAIRPSWPTATAPGNRLQLGLLAGRGTRDA